MRLRVRRDRLNASLVRRSGEQQTEKGAWVEMGTHHRKTAIGLASLLVTGAASAAWANTVSIEAEAARDPFRGGITSPMMIRDDSSASGGSFIEVAAGNNAQNSTPGTEGVAKLSFSVGNPGNYRVWARVKAATDGDDSFWVRMATWVEPTGDELQGHYTYGNWIKWNGIPTGGWRWVQVKAEGASAAAQFALSGDHQIQFGYREDGTKLDAIVVTDSTSFNPNATLTGPPALPVMQPVVSSRTALKVSWSAVPGATSYILERRNDGCCPYQPWQVIATGLTGHKYVDQLPIDTYRGYRVTAVAPTGRSQHDADPMAWDVSMGSGGTGNFYLRTQSHVLFLTPALLMTEFGSVMAPAGTESLNAPPAHGRARFDFEAAASAQVRVWANVEAPNKNQDSFWVRLDDGPWIKWNNLRTGCDDVHDSDNGDRGVVYNLTAGSHRFEFAHREGGAALTNIITMLEGVSPGGNPCSD
jgi:hypothetical protein